MEARYIRSSCTTCGVQMYIRTYIHVTYVRFLWALWQVYWSTACFAAHLHHSLTGLTCLILRTLFHDWDRHSYINRKTTICDSCADLQQYAPLQDRTSVWNPTRHTYVQCGGEQANACVLLCVCSVINQTASWRFVTVVGGMLISKSFLL